MDHIAAVAVELESGSQRYYLTWGRIQDRVDPEPLEQLVLKHCVGDDLGGKPVRARVCFFIREAANTPYFYEALFFFCQNYIPDGDEYEQWKKEIDEKMQNGGELYYLGNPEKFLAKERYAMDRIVAVAVTLENGVQCYFMTWGRIQDPINPVPLEDLILRQSTNFILRGRPIKARVCQMLQEAAQSPYFYENFFLMSQQPIPFGEHYAQWRTEMNEMMQVGKELYYLERPDHFSASGEPEMEHVVAIAVDLENDAPGYFMTWGRIQNRVDPEPLERLVLRNSNRFHLRARAVKARLCRSLQEAASAPAFYEGLFSFCEDYIPFDDEYEDWRTEMDEWMQNGKELYYLQSPGDPPPAVRG